MRKSILTAFLSVLALTGIFGQSPITVNTSPIAPASLTTCIGGTVNVVYSITNTSGSPLTWSNVTFKVQFNNMAFPTLIGSTAPTTITIPALSTTANFTVVATLPVVPDGLYDIRVKMYNNLNNAINNTSPVTPNQIYAKNPPATPTITPSGSLSVCNGSSIQLTSSPATTYTWSTGANTASIASTPTAVTIYSVSTSNNCGISTSAGTTVNVIFNPSISISSAGSNSICAGQSVTLNSSAINYTNITWSNAQTGTAITVTNSGTYYATATNACSVAVSNSIIVTVNPLPTVTALTSTSIVCSGQTVTLTASGANTYTLVTVGAFGGTTIINPPMTITYTVIGKNTLTGCTNTASLIQNVNPLPTLTISTSNTLLCVGQAAILSVSGANTYSWNAGPTTNTLAVNPTVNTVYNVTGVDLNGCVNSNGIMQNVTTCTGIENTNVKSVISKVYPVPSNDNVNIELSNVNDNSKISINIYSVEGKKVSTSETELNGNKTNISVVDLKSGMYILEIVSDNFKTSSRIIVNK